MDNVIVTGGSRGLGLGIARKLASSGYNVIALARTESQELAAAMEDARSGSTGTIDFVPFDLSAVPAIPELVKGIRASFGPIYGLVNNAGLGTSGILSTMPDQEIERLTTLNVLSPIVLTKYVVRSMMARNRGRVVNIASIVAATGYSGLSAYSATKASLVGFTRSLAREIGPLGITVNAVAPGFLDTDMTREMEAAQRERLARRSALQRLAQVDDVANAVEYLLDEKARNITGTVMTVDAGGTA